MTSPSCRAPASFLTTRWSVVFAAQRETSPEVAAALETLCRSYWYPLYAYVRRSGHDAPDAQDLTQEFFARLLAKDWLLAAAPERGRFRTFLLMAMKRFLANEWQRTVAQKRGGGITPVSLDSSDAEQRYAVEPALPPDEIFERRWAMTLLDQTLDRLQAEFSKTGKEREFEILKDCLTAERGDIPYAKLAAEMEASKGAARVAVHRLRKRFRATFREIVTQTVGDGSEVEEEMLHLVNVLSQGA